MLRNNRSLIARPLDFRRRRTRRSRRSPARPRARRQASFSMGATRRHLAIMVTLLVASVALLAIPLPNASGVFDKLLPLLTLVLGFFFGHQSN